MEIPKPHLLIMFLFGVFRATRADASAEIAVAVLKSGEGPASSSPPCSLWTRGGSMLPEQISLIHREAGRPVLNVDSMDGIIIGRLPCIPCFSLVSGARTDMGKMGLEAGRVRNKCNKIPHINFTILLLGSINSTLANYSRKHSAPTHLVRRIGLGSNAIEIKTVCPNGQVRSGSIWRVEQLESHMSSKCPHPLIGTRQRVSILGSLPYVNPAGLYGSDVDLMGIIADKLSFELDFKVERSFSNIIEGVANGTSAFGLGHLVIEYRSTAVVDLTHPPYLFEMVVATAKPKPLTPFFNLLRPFSLTVWVLVTLAIPITMGVLYFMFAKPELDNLNAKVWSCFQCVFGSMAGQGVPFSQKFGRRHFALVWIWLLYVNLVQMAYESNFRASLIDPKLENAVDSDLELYETGRDMYFARVGKQLPYFAQSPLPHRRALASRAVENKLLYACTPKGCPNVPELYSIISKGGGIACPKNGFFAIFGPIVAHQGGVNPYHIGKQPSSSRWCSIHVPKGVPWQHEISMISIRLQQAGIVDFLIGRYLRPRDLLQYYAPRELELVPLNTDHMAGAFIVLASAIGGAILGTTCELFSWRREKRKSFSIAGKGL